MEVRTVDETTVSLWTATRYIAITSILVGGLLLPTLVFGQYGKILNTMLLVFLVTLGARELLSAVFAFSSVDSPSLEESSEDDLPSVSVVIPAYNEEPVLPGTLDAALDLDYPAEKLEVLVCYEADSTDRTAEIAEEYAAKDDRIVAVRRDEDGGGKAKATNYALKYATGDLIASIDADHRFEPDAVRRAVAWFESDEDIGCVKGRCYGTNPTDSLLSLHATVERHVAEKSNIFAREVIDGFTFFGGGQAFFRAEVFEDLGPFDEEVLVEDIDMSARIHQAGMDIRVDPDIITYEEHPTTLDAWWNQRKRWARGWMQVAVKYLPRMYRDSVLTTRQQVDAMFTFVAAVLPAIFIFGFPIAGMDFLSSMETASYVPHAGIFWTVFGAVPIIAAYLVFIQDWADDHTHHPYEYLAAFTMGPYLMLQTIVYVVAFVDEFVLDRPAIYVTTTRSEKSTG